MGEFIGWLFAAMVTGGVFLSAHTVHNDAQGNLYICERTGHVSH